MDTDENPRGLLGCSLPGVDVSERETDWHALARRALVSTTRSADRAVFRFQKHPDVETELRRLIALERQCCALLGWDVVGEGSELALAITGSGDDAPMLDAFVARMRLLEIVPKPPNYD